MSDEGNRIFFPTAGEMFTRPNKGDHAATPFPSYTCRKRIYWHEQAELAPTHTHKGTDGGKLCIINQKETALINAINLAVGGYFSCHVQLVVCVQVK